MTTRDLESKSVEELWALHEGITSTLLATMEAEKLKLEKRLDQLGARIMNNVRQRRSYPEVHPKFRNPNPPHQTWSGRGKQPVWLRELLGKGKSLETFRIQPAA